MSVIAIASMVTIGLASAIEHMRNAHEGRHAAERFLGAVRECSRIAASEDCIVRLAFLTPDRVEELRSGGSAAAVELPQGGGFRIYRLSVPAKNSVALFTPGVSGTEVPAALNRLPRFESMTARWMPASHPHLGWLEHGRKVRVASVLFDEFTGSAGKPDSKWLYQPSQFWAAKPSANTSPFSIYHPDFVLTPLQTSESIVSGDWKDESTIEILGTDRTPDEIFDGKPMPHWSTAAPSGMPLPAMDFLPEGGLAGREQSEIRFEFSDEKNPDSRWTVVVETKSAKAWIE